MQDRTEAERLAMALHDRRRRAAPLVVSLGWHDLAPEDQAGMVAEAADWIAAMGDVRAANERERRAREFMRREPGYYVD